MKTVLVSAFGAALVTMTMSSAFALSNSPQSRVVVDTGAPIIASDGHQQAAPRRFLSGEQQADPNFGLSSNAIEGRDFLSAQKGRY